MLLARMGNVRGSAGFVPFATVYEPGDYTVAIPVGARTATIRGIGSGSAGDSSSAGRGAGGGAAYSESYPIDVTALTAVWLRVPAQVTVDAASGADAVARQNTSGGTVLMLAKGGNGRTGGASASGTGATKRSGGNGEAVGGGALGGGGAGGPTSNGSNGSGGNGGASGGSPAGAGGEGGAPSPGSNYGGGGGAREDIDFGYGAQGYGRISWDNAIILDAATKHPDMTLSGGDLTATTTQYANYAAAKTLSLVSAGKRYFEARATFSTDPTNVEVAMGLCTAAFNPAAGAAPGAAATNWALSPDGQVANNSSVVAAANVNRAFASGDWIRFAVDFTVGKVWIGNASGWAGDPAAGTGENFTFTPSTPLGAQVIAYSNNPPNPAGATFNFGASAFQYASPSGFVAWQA